MAGETVITIVGNLTADPELRTTSNGGAVANMTGSPTSGLTGMRCSCAAPRGVTWPSIAPTVSRRACA